MVPGSRGGFFCTNPGQNPAFFYGEWSGQTFNDGNPYNMFFLLGMLLMYWLITLLLQKKG